MAIFADYTRYINTVSETETFEQEVTYPVNLPEHDLKYEFRGQTVIETFPVINTETFVIKNAYIVIKSYIFYKFVKNENGENLFDIQYSVYNNKEDYLASPSLIAYEDDIIGSFHLISSEDDLRKKAYEILKNQINITNVIDD